MSEEKEEHIYTIPLRDVKKAPRWKRSTRAMTMIRDFLMRHTKPDYVLLDTAINEKVWERGSQKPPSRIRVMVTREEVRDKAERKMVIVKAELME